MKGNKAQYRIIFQSPCEECPNNGKKCSNGCKVWKEWFVEKWSGIRKVGERLKMRRAFEELQKETQNEGYIG